MSELPCSRIANTSITPHAQRQATLRGTIIKHWRITRTLGEGNYGTVFEAVHVHEAGREGALKLFHRCRASATEAYALFENEVNAAKAVKHPNIVEFFESGTTEDGDLYLAMELLRGETLHAVLKRGMLDWERMVSIGAQIADALDAAHQHDIIHRDLKPDNIMIITDGSQIELVKVLDFGMAKLLQARSEADHQTPSGVWKGTPAYMSPEQCRSVAQIDERADIYSLGAILYEGLVGQRLFSAKSDFDWLVAHVNQDFLQPPQFKALPQSLQDLLLCMLAKDREQRPRSMSIVAQELRRIRGALLRLKTSRVDDAVAKKEQCTGKVRRSISRYRLVHCGAAIAAILLSLILIQSSQPYSSSESPGPRLQPANPIRRFLIKAFAAIRRPKAIPPNPEVKNAPPTPLGSSGISVGR